MKKIYVEAELEVINLLNVDIITASGTKPSFTPSGDNDTNMGGW
jgi:hypothetical protein